MEVTQFKLILDWCANLICYVFIFNYIIIFEIVVITAKWWLMRIINFENIRLIIIIIEFFIPLILFLLFKEITNINNSLFHSRVCYPTSVFLSTFMNIQRHKMFIQDFRYSLLFFKCHHRKLNLILTHYDRRFHRIFSSWMLTLHTTTFHCF